MSHTITVLLVDDHDLVRIGIRRLLTDIEGIQVIGEANSGETALRLAKELNPDVVLMDVNMPGIGGLEATRRLIISHPEMKVIAVTVYGDEPFPSRLLQAGVSGYITKGSSLNEMIQAIHAVYAGQRYLSPEVAQQLAFKKFSEKDNNLFDALSDRELQILMMITNGQKAPDIAKALSLSSKTVNAYRYRLYEKLGVTSDVDLTHLAMRHGLLETYNTHPTTGEE